jgi:hypothetical protein
VARITAQDWLTLQDLGTQSGIILAVTVIVQFIKRDLDRLQRVPTRYVVLVIAWLLLGAYRGITGAYSAGGLLTDFLNGFLVAAAAMGTYEVAKTNLSDVSSYFRSQGGS